MVLAFPKLSVRVILIAASGLFVLTVAPSSRAQARGIAGKYECARVKVHGKLKPCASAQLTLKNDGRFELRGWEGEYVVSGESVELSEKSVKPKAKLEPGYKLAPPHHPHHPLPPPTHPPRPPPPPPQALS